MTNAQKIAAGIAAIAAVVGLIVVTTGDKEHPTKADAGPAETVADTTPPPIMSAPRPSASVAASNTPVPAGTSIDLATAAYEAKMVTRAQAAADRGDYKQALQEIEDYEKIPNRALLTPQATMIKIRSLSKVGRRTDALALAMETRTDDAFKDHREEVEAILLDAGLREP